MKIFVTLLSLILLASSGSAAVKKTTKKKLSTDVNFDDLVVNGKYAYPDEAIATIEDEKLLDDLLAVRKHFKDRLKISAERN